MALAATGRSMDADECDAGDDIGLSAIEGEGNEWSARRTVWRMAEGGLTSYTNTLKPIQPTTPHLSTYTLIFIGIDGWLFSLYLGEMTKSSDLNPSILPTSSRLRFHAKSGNSNGVRSSCVLSGSTWSR